MKTFTLILAFLTMSAFGSVAQARDHRHYSGHHYYHGHSHGHVYLNSGFGYYGGGYYGDPYYDSYYYGAPTYYYPRPYYYYPRPGISLHFGHW